MMGTTLESLLDQMRAAIATADFTAAASFAPQIEAALANLPLAVDQTALERIKTKADRNNACLEAARRGLRAARRRMEDVRRAAQGVQTYDDQGRRKDILQSSRTAGRF